MVIMRPATAYSKCYILYLFVTVILLSLTSLHMCVVVAAEEPLEENVVAELKQKAGEVETLAGDVREANKEMVESAESVLLFLIKAAENIKEAKKGERKSENEQKWRELLNATDTAVESADEAVKVAEEIQTAANKAGGAMQKMAERAKVISSDVENMRSFIDEFKSETDTIVSLWSEVSSDDVQSLLTYTAATVEQRNRAKREAIEVYGDDKHVPASEEKHEAKAQDASHSGQGTGTTTGGVDEKIPPPAVLPGVAEKTLQEQIKKDKVFTELNIKHVISKIMRLVQREIAHIVLSTNELPQNNGTENKNVVESLEQAAEESEKLNRVMQSVNGKINDARQLTEEIAQLTGTIIKVKESKELSVLPSSFGSFVFVVNNICLTTFVILTYMFRKTF